MKKEDENYFVNDLASAQVQLNAALETLKSTAVHAYRLRLENRLGKAHSDPAAEHLHERIESLRDALDENTEIESIMLDITSGEYDAEGKK